MSAHIGMAMSYWAHNMPKAPGDVQAMPGDIQRMLQGIHKYQISDFLIDRPDLQEVWRAGEVSIGAIPTHDYNDQKPTLLLVPSMINRAHILDLLPQRSMMRYLSAQGVNVYLLDWGDVCDDPDQASIERIITKRLQPAIKFVHEKVAQPVHALGYCMGGTLLTGAASLDDDGLRSLILLASPWDFHAGSQVLLDRMKFWAPTVLPSLMDKKNLPQDWLQTLFASLDPALAVQKFSKFLDMEPGSGAEHLFIAVEDWLNDGVDLPADVASYSIQGWFLENRAVHKTWRVGGTYIDPKNIECPALIIASSKDRLVEYPMAAALAQDIPHAQIHDPECGHIGMIAGRHAVENIWQKIADWVRDNS